MQSIWTEQTQAQADETAHSIQSIMLSRPKTKRVGLKICCDRRAAGTDDNDKTLERKKERREWIKKNTQMNNENIVSVKPVFISHSDVFCYIL